MTWVGYVKKSDGGPTRKGEFISLRAACVAFSADFGQLRIGSCSRVKVFVDAELRRLGFLFNNDVGDSDNYTLCPDGLYGRTFVCRKMLHTYPWIASALALPVCQRRFVPQRDNMIWFIELPQASGE